MAHCSFSSWFLNVSEMGLFDVHVRACVRECVRMRVCVHCLGHVVIFF